ncbi:MAG: hypothetical protein LBI19_06720 [Oscillospiraceae bacterium]|jgi:hypothetical protein|nr:hypothetical protein [Oscillospiraceae bacterium]
MRSDYVQFLKDYLSEILHCETSLLALRHFVINNSSKISRDIDLNDEGLKQLYDRYRFLYRYDFSSKTIEQIASEYNNIRHDMRKHENLMYNYNGEEIEIESVRFVKSVRWMCRKYESLTKIVCYEQCYECYERLNKLQRMEYDGYIPLQLKKSILFQMLCFRKDRKNLDLELTLINYVNNLISLKEEDLSSLLSLNIIDKRYRDITAVSSIFDYIDSGITMSLIRNGPDPGAYFLYNEDIRANRIVDAIEAGFTKIHNQLTAIQKNQYTLCKVIQDSNNILQRIESELNEANKALQGVSNELNAANYTLHEISNRQGITNDSLQGVSYGLMQGNITNANISYFAEETARNSRLQVASLRDRWGRLFTSDGVGI